jgi:hypothetical protein
LISNVFSNINIVKSGNGQALVAHAYNPSIQRAKIKRILDQSQPKQIVHETLSQNKTKTLHKKGLVEWLKVKVLSSNPCLQKKGVGGMCTS